MSGGVLVVPRRHCTPGFFHRLFGLRPKRTGSELHNTTYRTPCINRNTMSYRFKVSGFLISLHTKAWVSSNISCDCSSGRSSIQTLTSQSCIDATLLCSVFAVVKSRHVVAFLIMVEFYLAQTRQCLRSFVVWKVQQASMLRG